MPEELYESIEPGSVTVEEFKAMFALAFIFILPFLLGGGVWLLGSFYRLPSIAMWALTIASIVTFLALIILYYYKNAMELLGKRTYGYVHRFSRTKDAMWYLVEKENEFIGQTSKGEICPKCNLKMTPDEYSYHLTFDDPHFPHLLLHAPVPLGNLIETQRDWIPYKGLIYPASVTYITGVEERQFDLGLEENPHPPIPVAWIIDSNWHGEMVQKGVKRFPNPTSDSADAVITAYGAHQALEYKEKLRSAESQIRALREATKDMDKRTAQIVENILDKLEATGRKTKTLVERISDVKITKQTVFKIGFGIIVIVIAILAGVSIFAWLI